MIDAGYRNKGYASFHVQTKAGMDFIGNNEEGDPQFYIDRDTYERKSKS